MKPEILLFHPPNILKPQALNRAIMSPIMCGYGLLHIGAHLMNRGYKVECWNIPLAYKLGFDNDHLMGILKNYSPLLIGIELNWLHLSKGALDLAKFLKSIYENVPIVVGGVHATIFAEQIIQSNEMIDIVVKGEAEKIMEDIVTRIEKNQDFKVITGTISKEDGKINKNDGKNIYEDLDVIPPYSPNFLMPKTLNPYNLAMINTCRGPCNYNCVHCLGAKSKYCLSPRSKIAFHSISWLIKQISILLDHVDNFSIQDYVYCNPKLLIELAKAIRQEKLQDSFNYFNVALVPSQNISREIINWLAKSGVDNIDVGIESGSDYVLQKLNRPYDTQVSTLVIKNAVRNGIQPKTYWMITGLERQKDLDLNKKFLKETIKMGGIPKWITPLCILPMTQLYERAKRYGITLKMSRFEDYLIFSTEKYNRTAYYPHCVTHETKLMNVYDILKAVNDLKTFILHQKDLILSKIKENEKFYLSAQNKLNGDQIMQRILKNLGYIRSNFF
ncbi:MAG: B12-binding domain-containing radical SAM protein [Candidatus Helarchaeota archaeon]|nr:B12-binding domain-containing radical SAM protein [Candidatus Helarchaeota archaeon]